MCKKDEKTGINKNCRKVTLIKRARHTVIGLLRVYKGLCPAI